jgi:hypothetical protein
MRRVLSVAVTIAVAVVGVVAWYSYVLVGRQRAARGSYAGRQPGDFYPR